MIVLSKASRRKGGEKSGANRRAQCLIYQILCRCQTVFRCREGREGLIWGRHLSSLVFEPEEKGRGKKTNGLEIRRSGGFEGKSSLSRVKTASSRVCRDGLSTTTSRPASETGGEEKEGKRRISRIREQFVPGFARVNGRRGKRCS